jgi:hypothetical protein
MPQKQNRYGQPMPLAGGAPWRPNERLLTGGEGDHKRRRHSGNHAEFGKVALADRAELHSLCQSFVDFHEEAGLP